VDAMRFGPVLAVVLLSVGLAACRNPASPDDPNVVNVTGTVRFRSIEGGFWVVAGDDGVSYDPLDGLPAGFQVEGLRVRLEARRRLNMGSIHNAGLIVEIIRIVKLQ
jgi:hypothetical protein